MDLLNENSSLDNKTIDKLSKDLNEKLSNIIVRNVNKTDNILKIDSNGIISSTLKFEKTTIDNIEYIALYGNDDAIIGKIPTSEFKIDGMLENVEFSKEENKSNILILTFNTSSGKQPIEVDFSKYVDTYKADESTITLNNNVFSVKENIFDAYGSSEKIEKKISLKLEEIANQVVNKTDLKTINDIILLKNNDNVNIELIGGAGAEITTISKTNTIEINSKISKKQNNAIKLIEDGIFVQSIYVDGDDVEGNIIIHASETIQNNEIYDGDGNTLIINESMDDNTIINAKENATIKNVNINGNNNVTSDNKSLRAIYITKPENVNVDSVNVFGVGYAFNVIGSNVNATINIQNSTLTGWTSFDPVKSATFNNVSFRISNYYENGSMFNGGVRPYSSTTFENCSFEKGFYISTVELNENENLILNLSYATIYGYDYNIDLMTMKINSPTCTFSRVKFRFTEPESGNVDRIIVDTPSATGTHFKYNFEDCQFNRVSFGNAGVANFIKVNQIANTSTVSLKLKYSMFGCEGESTAGSNNYANIEFYTSSQSSQGTANVILISTISPDSSNDSNTLNKFRVKYTSTSRKCTLTFDSSSKINYYSDGTNTFDPSTSTIPSSITNCVVNKLY